MREAGADHLLSQCNKTKTCTNWINCWGEFTHSLGVRWITNLLNSSAIRSWQVFYHRLCFGWESQTFLPGGLQFWSSYDPLWFCLALVRWCFPHNHLFCSRRNTVSPPRRSRALPAVLLDSRWFNSSWPGAYFPADCRESLERCQVPLLPLTPFTENAS